MSRFVRNLTTMVQTHQGLCQFNGVEFIASLYLSVNMFRGTGITFYGTQCTYEVRHGQFSTVACNNACVPN